MSQQQSHLRASDEIVEHAWRSDPLPLPAMPPSRLEMRRRAVAAWLAASGVDLGDLLVAAGICLLARGCYLLAPAAGWIVPGLVLLWYALPQRPRFVEPPVPPAKPPSQFQGRNDDGRP